MTWTLVLLALTQDPSVSWADFGAESWVRIRVRRMSPGGRLRDDWTDRTVYKGMEAGQVLLEVTHQPADGEALAPRPRKAAPAEWSGWAFEKEESVELAGRRIACRVYAQEGSRVWIAGKDTPVPGWDVKFESRSDTLTRASRIAAWDEAVKVGERESTAASGRTWSTST